MDFEWDDTKADENFRKHRISFDVAIGVFADAERTERFEADTSVSEQRWNTTGLIEGTEVYVVYTMRGEVTRLISARRANRHEREEYWNREI